MISVAFINNGYEPLLASDPFLPLEKLMKESTEEIDSMISSYLNIHDQYMIESEIMGEIDEEKSLYLEAEKTNVFDKIGNAVISVFKKIQDIIKKFIEFIKNIGFKNKSNEEKMRALLDHYKKEDPEKYRTIKDDVIVAFNSGELDAIDMKSLKEMNEAYDEFVKLAKQKDVKPDSLRAKFDSMKKKFENIDKPVKTVSSIITVAIALVTFKSKILDSRKNTIEYEKKLAEKNESTIKALDELQKYQGGEFASETLTKAQLLKNANFWITGQYGKLISKEQGGLKKLDNGITSWIANHEKNKRDNFMDGVNRGSKVISDKEKQARNTERENKKEELRDSLEVKNKFEKKTKKERASASYNDTITKAKAKDDYDDKHQKEHDKKLDREARVRTQAQKSESDKYDAAHPKKKNTP